MGQNNRICMLNLNCYGMDLISNRRGYSEITASAASQIVHTYNTHEYVVVRADTNIVVSLYVRLHIYNKSVIALIESFLTADNTLVPSERRNWL